LRHRPGTDHRCGKARQGGHCSPQATASATVFEALSGQNLSYEARLIEDAFVRSMTDKRERSENEETCLIYGVYEPLTVTPTHILNRRAGLAWTS